MLTYMGSLSLSVAMPFLTLLSLNLGPFIAELQAKFAAMVKLSVAASLTLPAVTAALMAQAAFKLAAKPPQVGINASLAYAASLKLQAQIQLLLQLTQYNATAGVHMFVYDGPANGLGPALIGAHTSMGIPPNQGIYATILIAQAGTGAAPVLKAVFKTP